MSLIIIGIVCISSIHFPQLLHWLYRQYCYIDGQLDHKKSQIKCDKTVWLSAGGYILEFCKGAWVPWAIENYTYYNDNVMVGCFIMLLTLYIFNPLQKFKPRNHDWVVLFSGVLYFLSPMASLFFIIGLLSALILTNSISWAYIIALIISGIILNNTITTSQYLIYFLAAVIPIGCIISSQLYDFHTLRKGTLTGLIKR
jgi:hypothetical protein